MNEKKIEDTQKVLQKGGVITNEVRRNFAFRLSLKDFDKRGDMDNFNATVFQRGPIGKTEKYVQPSKEWFRIGLKVDGKYPEHISCRSRLCSSGQRDYAEP